MKTYTAQEIDDLYIEYMNYEMMRVGNAYYFKNNKTFGEWLKHKELIEEFEQFKAQKAWDNQ